MHIKNLTATAGSVPQATIPWECVPLDEGFLDWAQIITELKRIGYEGYLTLEELALHPRFGSVQEMMSWDVQYLRGLL